MAVISVDSYELTGWSYRCEKNIAKHEHIPCHVRIPCIVVTFHTSVDTLSNMKWLFSKLDIIKTKLRKLCRNFVSIRRLPTRPVFVCDTSIVIRNFDPNKKSNVKHQNTISCPDQCWSPNSRHIGGECSFNCGCFLDWVKDVFCIYSGEQIVHWYFTLTSK